MSAKALGYLEQLDKARCEGNWPAVPELVRKVRKHAPERACLAATAEAECAVSGATSTITTAKSSSRPTTADANPNLDVDGTTRQLLELIGKEGHYAEDRYQAQVCVGWLHWVVAEYSQALTRLPKSYEQDDTQADPAVAVSEWTTVCALKSAYLRANCLARNYQRKEALETFQSGLPALARVWSGRASQKQLSYWAELFLTEYCILQSQALEDEEVPLEDHNSVASFRSWAKYWDVTASSPAGGFGFKGSVPRRQVWKEYYKVLSRILERNLPFPTGYLNEITTEKSARVQMRAELERVESVYQGLLFRETTFPRSDEQRDEVEAFVKVVIQNWSVLCGRGWREQDLGKGGRDGLSRRVLDLLYSAATKTYHSTAILRCLFMVHLAVGEFELALKAFDSYLEIVKKGKARVDKTGHPEPSLDDDGTVLQTMSQAIIALCQYGPVDAAEKARDLGAELENLLATLPQLVALKKGAATIADNDGKMGLLHPPIPPHIVALSWQAIGLMQAHWSRVTHEAASRTEIQGRAISCLRSSLASDFGRSKDIRSYFSLGLLLAERRELAAAIEVVKTALAQCKGHEEQYSLRFGQHWQERSLIPLWHLLALLLSARQDYTMAVRACEEAMEQFKDPSILFGKENTTFASDHLNQIEDRSSPEAPKGLVDEMDDAEKEAIMEVKMTQLSLVELLEGPDVAVNASSELLALFSRLFGNMAPQQATLNPPKAREPPKTSGTLRSIRGSIFGGKDKSRPPTRQQSNATLSETSGATPARPQTSKTVASVTPTVQVTGSDGHDVPGSRRSSVGQVRRSDSRQRNSLRKRDRSMSRHRTPSTTFNTQPSQPETVVDGEPFFTPAPVPDGGESSDFFTFTSKQPSSLSSFSRGRTLPTLNSFMSGGSKSSTFSELTADEIHASTDLLPLIQFSKEKQRARRTAILIRVWLMLAGFYRRADLYDDAKSAVAEAQKLVQALEADANREPSVSSGTKNAGWAEKKSIEDLWGDVFSEAGQLSLSQDSPYVARSEFESALIHCPNHPAATVGLGNILLDIYSEKLRPTPTITPLDDVTPPSDAEEPYSPKTHPGHKVLPTYPLGLKTNPLLDRDTEPSPPLPHTDLPEPYKATCLPLSDRLAARDRAYALLSGLTRLGTGWNYSDAWFALARAYEESGQPDKTKEVLWWCVELEEARGVRDWAVLGGGGYVV